MTFGHPLLLLTLLVVPAAVGAYWLLRRRRMRYALAYSNLGVLASVSGGRSWRRIVAPLLFLLALATLAVAVARPHVKTLVPQDRATVILVLDASRSMESNDVKPTRLAAAEQALNTFLDKAPKRLQVGLVVFAGDAQVAAPPTADHELVRQSLRLAEDYPGYSGTAIGDALQVAVDLGKQAVSDVQAPGGTTIAYRTGAAAAAPPRPGSSPLVSILFLSDGRQTTGALTPMQGADLARNAGFPVYTVALGTNGGGSLPGLGPGNFGGGNFGGGGFFGGGSGRRFDLSPDRPTLRAIAQRTGGEYFAARSANAVQSAYENLGSRLGRKPGNEEVTSLFVAGAAALLVLAAIASALWAPRLP